MCHAFLFYKCVSLLDGCNHPVSTKQVVHFNMQPLSSLLTVEKSKREPVYLQVSNQLMELIKKGILPAGHRLLSTRELSAQLNIHRKTVIQAYDELLAQG